jgi:hypothetical protein
MVSCSCQAGGGYKFASMMQAFKVWHQHRQVTHGSSTTHSAAPSLLTVRTSSAAALSDATIEQSSSTAGRVCSLRGAVPACSFCTLLLLLSLESLGFSLKPLTGFLLC